MMQEHQECAAISKKLLKAKEAKILYKNKSTSSQSLEDLKEKIDKDNAFGTDLKVKI